jgi:hypothetical protein
MALRSQERKQAPRGAPEDPLARAESVKNQAW